MFNLFPDIGRPLDAILVRPPKPVILKPVMVDLPCIRFGKKRIATEYLIWHCTAGESYESSVEWLNRPNCPPKEYASYHFGIDRDGTIYQSVAIDLTAYASGRSEWPNPRNEIPAGVSLNTRTINVAFANRDVPVTHKRFELVTVEQIEAARELTRWLVSLYPRLGAPERSLRHRDVAPTRKVDPIPHVLDFDLFRRRLFDTDYRMAA